VQRAADRASNRYNHFEFAYSLEGRARKVAKEHAKKYFEWDLNRKPMHLYVTASEAFLLEDRILAAYCQGYFDAIAEVRKFDVE
jgi:hypothetical protein